MRRSLVAGILVALALALTGCGGDSKGGDGASSSGGGASGVSTIDLLASAPEKAADAGSARFEMTFRVPSVTSGSVSASGVVDFTGNDMQMSMNLRDLAPSAPDVEYEARMVDGVMYMNLGSALGVGRPWMKLDPSALGVSQSQLDQQQNPADFLDSLRGIADIHEVGRDTVRGVATTEYDGTIDLGRAMEEADPGVRDRLEQSLASMVRSVPVRVWVDDDGLPRRLQMDITAEGASVTMTMEFYDYGVPVDISAPPADQVGDMSSLLGAGLGASSA